MQSIDGGTRRTRRKAILGTMALGLVVAGSCDCGRRLPSSPAPTAAVAPQWQGTSTPQPAPSLHDLPASHDRPAYGLPLVIKIERIPEVPERIKGPMKKEVRDEGPGGNNPKSGPVRIPNP